MTPKTYTLQELKTMDERREKVALMMLHGEWKGAATRKELSEAWGISRPAMRELEEAAMGACRLAIREEWPQRVAQALAELDAVKAAAWRGDEDGPNLKAVIEATKLQLQVYGALSQPMKSREPTESDYDKMSHAERAKRLREAAEAEEMAARGARH